MLKTPLAIVNFKAYSSAIGSNAVKLAKDCEKAAKKCRGVTVTLAVSCCDIAAVAKAVKLPVLAQHVDSFEFGAHTGAVLAEAAKQAGAVGSLLNHSEKRIDLVTLKNSIEQLHKAKMIAVACANAPKAAIMIAGLNPDFIAIEPPELIGGNIAVSSAKPEIITETTENVRKIPVLCGAGIKTQLDVEKAVKLGAKGILISSGITLAKNPAQELEWLLNGLKRK